MYGMDIIKYRGQTIIQVYDDDNNLIDETYLDFIRPKTVIDNLVLSGIIKGFKQKYDIKEINTFTLDWLFNR